MTLVGLPGVRPLQSKQAGDAPIHFRDIQALQGIYELGTLDRADAVRSLLLSGSGDGLEKELGAWDIPPTSFRVHTFEASMALRSASRPWLAPEVAEFRKVEVGAPYDERESRTNDGPH
jgi:hypothetical protein